MENKKWIILCILAGILIIIWSIIELSIIFSAKYVSAIKILKESSASAFSITLFVFGCIILVGGILVLLGPIIVVTKSYKFGTKVIHNGISVALIGVIVGLIGLTFFFITSIFLMIELRIFALLIIKVVVIYSGFCFVSILFAMIINWVSAIFYLRELRKIPGEIPDRKKQLTNLTISIDKLREEALRALNEGELIKSSEKFMEIKNVLKEYKKLV